MTIHPDFTSAMKRPDAAILANCLPVIGPDGTIYPSHAAAAAALGVSNRTIGYHLDRHGNLNRVGRVAARQNHPMRRAVTLAGRQWPSVALLADYLGLHHETVRRWRRLNDVERLLGALMKADAKSARSRMQSRGAA